MCCCEELWVEEGLQWRFHLSDSVHDVANSLQDTLFYALHPFAIKQRWKTLYNGSIKKWIASFLCTRVDNIPKPNLDIHPLDSNDINNILQPIKITKMVDIQCNSKAKVQILQSNP